MAHGSYGAKALPPPRAQTSVFFGCCGVSGQWQALGMPSQFRTTKNVGLETKEQGRPRAGIFGTLDGAKQRRAGAFNCRTPCHKQPPQSAKSPLSLILSLPLTHTHRACERGSDKLLREKQNFKRRTNSQQLDLAMQPALLTRNAIHYLHLALCQFAGVNSWRKKEDTKNPTSIFHLRNIVKDAFPLTLEGGLNRVALHEGGLAVKS